VEVGGKTGYSSKERGPVLEGGELGPTERRNRLAIKVHLDLSSRRLLFHPMIVFAAPPYPGARKPCTGNSLSVYNTIEVFIYYVK